MGHLARTRSFIIALMLGAGAGQSLASTLDAVRDLRVESAENGMDQSTDSSSWTATVGVSARGGKGGAAVGGHASGSVGESDQDAHDLTHTESVIEASGALTLRSGRDTTVKGGVARPY